MNTFICSALICLSWLPGFIQARVLTKKLTITYAKGAPDGIERDMIFINGQFPGPDLIFDEGDDVVVRSGSLVPLRNLKAMTLTIAMKINVVNDMPFNTTVHWHGLL
jgi:FtsP/CotA-like multicopper oxidase with cupredoxin domain